MARASTYTEAIANEIVERLSEGEPLRAICRDEHMPGWVTVYRWMERNKEFEERIARARSLGHDALAEQCLSISDDERHDWVLTEKGEVTNEVAIARAKLQVWTRMQLLAKWSPKKYGDKTSMELTGKDGGPVEISDTERAAKIASILAAAQARKSGTPDDGSDLV